LPAKAAARAAIALIDVAPSDLSLPTFRHAGARGFGNPAIGAMCDPPGPAVALSRQQAPAAPRRLPALRCERVGASAARRAVF